MPRVFAVAFSRVNFTLQIKRLPFDGVSCTSFVGPRLRV
jgi:hypothetical protein